MVLSTRGQAELRQQGSWDPLGMRGTCSPSFIVEARFPAEQILDVPFSRVAADSMVPVSHLLWSHVWLGLATDAFDRAKAFVRASARQHPGEIPAAARRLSALMTELALLRGEVTSALRAYVESPAQELNTMASAVRFNTLKVAASEQAPKVCLGALNVCGIVGYKNDTEFSVGRHLRDVLSAPLMVTNERIHETNASLLLIAKDV
jgi:acyl-CoA dehydrogenase